MGQKYKDRGTNEDRPPVGLSTDAGSTQEIATRKCNVGFKLSRYYKVIGDLEVRIEGWREGQKKGWNKKGDAVSVEVSGFNNKCMEIFIMVVMFVSILMGYGSRPCYGYESVAFFHATIHSGHDLTVCYDFMESHTFKDAFHVDHRIFGRNYLAEVTSVGQGASVVGSYTEFHPVVESF
jgi:hypothetical protein